MIGVSAPHCHEELAIIGVNYGLCRLCLLVGLTSVLNSSLSHDQVEGSVKKLIVASPLGESILDEFPVLAESVASESECSAENSLRGESSPIELFPWCLSSNVWSCVGCEFI